MTDASMAPFVAWSAIAIGLATYRVTRLLLLDHIADPPRNWVGGRLLVLSSAEPRRQSRLAAVAVLSRAVLGALRLAARFLLRLMECAICMTVWVAAAGTALWCAAFPAPGAAVPFILAGASTVATVIYRYVESD